MIPVVLKGKKYYFSNETDQFFDEKYKRVSFLIDKQLRQCKKNIIDKSSVKKPISSLINIYLLQDKKKIPLSRCEQISFKYKKPIFETTRNYLDNLTKKENLSYSKVSIEFNCKTEKELVSFLEMKKISYSKVGKKKYLVEIPQFQIENQEILSRIEKICLK